MDSGVGKKNRHPLILSSQLSTKNQTQGHLSPSHAINQPSKNTSHHGQEIKIPPQDQKEKRKEKKEKQNFGSVVWKMEGRENGEERCADSPNSRFLGQNETEFSYFFRGGNSGPNEASLEKKTLGRMVLEIFLSPIGVSGGMTEISGWMDGRI